MSNEAIDRSKLPIRRPPFQGKANRTLDGSEPDWNSIAPIPAPEGAPNVLLVLTDDAGKFAKHRLESGIGKKMDAALPPGSGGVIAVYDTGGADTVDKALANAVKKSVAQIDGMSAKKLKTGLAEAQAGMGG